jgi:hypothetical protein
VLAGQFYSRNAGGAAGEEPAAELVDEQRRDFADDALAVLKTLREPNDRVAEAGDAAVWHRMIDAAIAEAAPIQAD